MAVHPLSEDLKACWDVRRRIWSKIQARTGIKQVSVCKRLNTGRRIVFQPNKDPKQKTKATMLKGKMSKKVNVQSKSGLKPFAKGALPLTSKVIIKSKIVWL